MDLSFDNYEEYGYHSGSQIARVVTEGWMSKNMYCPRCGALHIVHFENNRPVADFYCPACKSEYELKSKNGSLGKKISDGAYETMIDRITSNNNPDFFFMSYSKTDMCVKNMIFIPKYCFVPEIIEKRKPLASTARRAGWVGCNILIDRIPEQGRVSIIENGKIVDIQNVLGKVSRSKALEIRDINGRGWFFDVLSCVNRINKDEFLLGEVYDFENELAIKHPMNRNIRAKIRQQLQLLRDRGYIEFMGGGIYRKV